MYMKDWKEEVDNVLKMRHYKILDGKGKISKLDADTKASKEYEKFKVKQDKNYISDFDKLTMKSKKINDKKQEGIYFNPKNGQTFIYKRKHKLMKNAKICGFGELKQIPDVVIPSVLRSNDRVHNFQQLNRKSPEEERYLCHSKKKQNK